MMEIEMPSGVQVEVNGTEVSVKGALGTNTRRFNDALLKVSASGNRLSIVPVDSKKLKEKARTAEVSFAKVVRNDIDGVLKYYEINMQTVSAHFPISLEMKGNVLQIKNLIGERAARTAKMVGKTKAEAKGQTLKIYGISKEEVTQSAANVRKACKIRFKDTRIFQDGLYFTPQ
jgi:large subunit ribosomal protein L6